MRDGGGAGGNSKMSKVPALLTTLNSLPSCLAADLTFFFSSSLLLFFFLFISVVIFVQLSWSKSLVRKWFNIRGKSHDFHADAAAVGTGTGRRSGERATQLQHVPRPLCFCGIMFVTVEPTAHHSLEDHSFVPSIHCSSFPLSSCPLLLLVLVKLSKASTFQNLFSVLYQSVSVFHC